MADAWTEKLDVYLDGELPAGEMSALDGHVRICTDCAASILQRLHLKRTVQTAGKRYSPSLEFRQRMLKVTAAKQPRSSWYWQILTAAAVFVIAIGVIFVQIRQANYSRQIYSEIADLHVATLASASPVDVISTDRHTVKPWFEGKIPFTFNLPELQNTEFTLLGGRISYLEQMPGAQLIYHVRKHQISVFIFPEKSNLPGDLGLHLRSTFEVQSWTQGNLHYFVIGDTSGDDIGKLVQLFKSAESQ